MTLMRAFEQVLTTYTNLLYQCILVPRVSISKSFSIVMILPLMTTRVTLSLTATVANQLAKAGLSLECAIPVTLLAKLAVL